jgi:hypothetical protein
MTVSLAVATEQILQRIRSEYLEMPGLRLTPQQAQRLWGLDRQCCEESLQYLVDAGFLMKTGRGTYVRLTDGPIAFPRMRRSTDHGRLSAAVADRG